MSDELDTIERALKEADALYVGLSAQGHYHYDGERHKVVSAALAAVQEMRERRFEEVWTEPDLLADWLEAKDEARTRALTFTTYPNRTGDVPVLIVREAPPRAPQEGDR